MQKLQRESVLKTFATNVNDHPARAVLHGAQPSEEIWQIKEMIWIKICGIFIKATD